MNAFDWFRRRILGCSRFCGSDGSHASPPSASLRHACGHHHGALAARLFINWYGNQKGEGIEYHLLALGIAITLMIVSAGVWSLDGALASARTGRTVGVAQGSLSYASKSSSDHCVLLLKDRGDPTTGSSSTKSSA